MIRFATIANFADIRRLIHALAAYARLSHEVVSDDDRIREHLFVQPEYRSHGHGKALFLALAKIAVDRGCGRLKWSVLDWNQPAIHFYRTLGAKPLDKATVYRLTGDALQTAGSG